MTLEEELDAITQVIRFKTSDGREHTSKESAERRAKMLSEITKANEILEAGGTVMEALLAMGWHEPNHLFHHVTKDTKLVIEHWQCCKQPVYTIKHIDEDGFFMISGKGGWSGLYGNAVSPHDLSYYVERTFKDFPKTLPK